MPSPHPVAILALSLVLNPPSLVAQDRPVLVPAGAEVRIRIPEAVLVGRLGHLLSQGDATLILCRPGRSPCGDASRSIPLATVSELWVASGTHWKRGALIGGGVGAVAGAALLALAAANCTSSPCDGGDWAPLGLVVLGGIGVTAGIGALAGSGSTRWTRILPPH